MNPRGRYYWIKTAASITCGLSALSALGLFLHGDFFVMAFASSLVGWSGYAITLMCRLEEGQ